jgi:hypothetical protein
MDKKERRGKRKGKKGKRKGKKEKRGKTKKQERVIWTFYNLNPTGEAVLPYVFQNSSNSIRKAAPSEELEPKLF